MSRLDPWRNGLEPPKGEEADRILQANFDEQAKFNDKIGLYLAGEASTNTEAALTSTSFVAWAGLKVSANTSGGLVVVFIQPHAKVAGSALTGRLLINGEEKRRWTFAAANIVSQAPAWVWVGTLKEGQNVFAMECKTDTATVELQDNIYGTTTSTMQVLEFTKG